MWSFLSVCMCLHLRVHMTRACQAADYAEREVIFGQVELTTGILMSSQLSQEIYIHASSGFVFSVWRAHIEAS